MLVGSMVLLAGAAAFASGRPAFEVVPTWMSFFVLTIVAERLELSRLAPTPRWAKRLLLAASAALAVLALVAIAAPWALRSFGAFMAFIGLWQVRFDLARRTLRRAGLPRYAAVGVLAGAIWLMLAGVGMAAYDLPAAGPGYDAVLHAVFVGYVLSMVFAHAPIILPAVARIDVRFHRALYVPVALLHLSLAARIAGDIGGQASLRAAGGVGNASALLALVVTVVWLRPWSGGERAAA
jgi:hypothetical protein